MTPNKKNELVELLKTILISIGFTDIVSKLNKVTNTETCFFQETNVGDKTVSFVVLNEEVASATKKRFGDWKVDEGIVVESTGKNNVYWKITIPFRILEKVKKEIEKTKPHIPEEKTKERLLIEDLLFGKGLAPSIKQLKDDPWFTITFLNSHDCDEAKKLLTDDKIDYASEGTKQLFVCVSLPDNLLQEERLEESEADRIARHITEYYGRLILLVTKKLGFTTKVPYGPRHKGEKFVYVSRKNGNCRLEFCTLEEKSTTEVYLTTAGFSCFKPKVDEKYVVMIDLSESTQAVLTQNIAVEEPTAEAITPIPEQPEQDSNTEKTKKMETQQPTPLGNIREYLATLGIKSGTFVKKEEKITLNITDGDPQTAATKIKEQFNISASLSPRKTSVVLLSEEISIQKKSPKNKKVETKDSLAGLKAFLENASDYLNTLASLPTANKEEWLKEVEKEYFLCKIEDGKIELPVSDDTMISGKKATFVVKTLKKAKK